MASSKLDEFVEFLDAFPHPAFLTDSKHVVLGCNQAFASDVGVDGDIATQSCCQKLVHGTDAPFPGCPLEESVVTGRCVEEDLFDPWNDSWARVMVCPTRTRTPDGRRVFLHLARDITKDRQDQEEEARLHRDLIRIQKTEAVCKLADGIAHEFNNLLFILASNAEMAASKIRSGSAAMVETNQILETIKRGVALTRQLQIFGRRDAGEPQVLDVNDVLTDITQQLQSMLGEKIELTIEPGSNPWPVAIDRKQLEQVILNLSANARDAMPDGGTLTIESTNVESGLQMGPALEPIRYVLIKVSDTGIGMGPEFLERIFEPLFTTKQDGGALQCAGLGLCVVENTMARAGGRIAVNSKPGRGTLFEIYLRADIGDGGFP